MSNWINDFFSPSTIVALIVGIVALWYTIETQKLRKVAVKQLLLMRQSMSGQIMPYVLSGIINWKDLKNEEKKQKINEQLDNWDLSRIDIPGISNRGIDLRNKDESLIFEVSCNTDQLASHVICLYYNHKTRSFKIPPYYLEVIAPRESGYFQMLQEEVDDDSVCELIQKIYEDRGEYLNEGIKKIAEKKESWIIPIFFDLAGRLYATPRKVYEIDGQFQYGKSDVLQPKDFSENFMESFSSTKKAFEE